MYILLHLHSELMQRMSALCNIFKVLSKYLSSPNSNFPGPFLKKLPLIQAGIVPLVVVGMGSGVSSPECTNGATLSSPLACGHRSLLGTGRVKKKKINFRKYEVEN